MSERAAGTGGAGFEPAVEGVSGDLANAAFGAPGVAAVPRPVVGPLNRGAVHRRHSRSLAFAGSHRDYRVHSGATPTPVTAPDHAGGQATSLRRRCSASISAEASRRFSSSTGMP